MENKEVESVVHHLIEVANERKEGYKKAAENVKDPELETVFDNYSEQSSRFANELAQFELETPEDIGTRVIGDTWHIWMDIKGAVTGGDRKAMINASITGEENALDNYEDALGKNLPFDLKNIVQRQYDEIKQAVERIKVYKETTA